MAAFPVIGITEIVSALPVCSFCSNRATYDFLTVKQLRAYGCVQHYMQHRMYTFLGLGSATRLVLAGTTKEDIKHGQQTDSA